MDKQAMAAPSPRKQATRVKIYEAARDLFLEQGYDGVTIEQIASRAGTRRSTLYNHFSDKEAILSALIYDYMEAVRDILSQVPGPAPTQTEVDEWIKAFADVAARKQMHTALVMRTGSSRQVPPAVIEFGNLMTTGLADRLPAFKKAMASAKGRARVQSVLRELGWALVHHVEDPATGKHHLKVAGEWFDALLRRYEQP
jgi:AcrR family transcriptional regulator